jgi:hypothetical protein
MNADQEKASHKKAQEAQNEFLRVVVLVPLVLFCGLLVRPYPRSSAALNFH